MPHDNAIYTSLLRFFNYTCVLIRIINNRIGICYYIIVWVNYSLYLDHFKHNYDNDMHSNHNHQHLHYDTSLLFWNNLMHFSNFNRPSANIHWHYEDRNKHTDTSKLLSSLQSMCCRIL